MRQEKLLPERVMAGMQKLSRGGYVNFGVFDSEVVSVNCNSGSCKKPQTDYGQALLQGYLHRSFLRAGLQCNLTLHRANWKALTLAKA